MSRAQRERFLAGTHVAVLGVTDHRTGGSAPLLTPVWYAYEPGGEVLVQTARTAVKARLLRAAGRFSLCVQDEGAPYRYVSVEGPVVGERDPLPESVRTTLVRRYLPEEQVAGYLEATAGQLDEDVLFHMRPERWRTADFAAFATRFS
ncbi:pyridoxamine 5'-phosphate oxidase family protein [Streptomyces sp. NPDC050560]|uniref:pyridoxamine 5'-phosphate oxidase family protein n=1 Tax=Streptomyces sp. NPDC050560 TaxID=3365630 RepID=UPI00378EBFF8